MHLAPPDTTVDLPGDIKRRLDRRDSLDAVESIALEFRRGLRFSLLAVLWRVFLTGFMFVRKKFVIYFDESSTNGI